MYIKTILAALAAFFICTAQVSAQPSDRFPDSIYLTQDNTTYRGFDLGGFAELLRIDSDLQSSLQQITVLTQEIDHYKLQIGLISDALELAQTNLRLVTEDRQRLTEVYDDTNRRLHELENKPNYLGILGWTTATVSVGISLGLIIGRIVNR